MCHAQIQPNTIRVHMSHIFQCAMNEIRMSDNSVRINGETRRDARLKIEEMRKCECDLGNNTQHINHETPHQ